MDPIIAAALRDAKSPAQGCQADSSAKQAEVTARLLSLVDEHLAPIYERLEASRLATMEPRPEPAPAGA